MNSFVLRLAESTFKMNICKSESIFSSRFQIIVRASLYLSIFVVGFHRSEITARLAALVGVPYMTAGGSGSLGPPPPSLPPPPFPLLGFPSAPLGLLLMEAGLMRKRSAAITIHAMAIIMKLLSPAPSGGPGSAPSLKIRNPN